MMNVYTFIRMNGKSSFDLSSRHPINFEIGGVYIFDEKPFRMIDKYEEKEEEKENA